MKKKSFPWHAKCLTYVLEDLKAYLKSGQEKWHLEQRQIACFQSWLNQRKRANLSFQKMFALSLKKLKNHLGNHPTWPYYKDLWPAPAPHYESWHTYVAHFDVIPGLKNPSPELHEYEQSAIPTALKFTSLLGEHA